jgi:hypothetical protein
VLVELIEPTSYYFCFLFISSIHAFLFFLAFYLFVLFSSFYFSYFHLSIFNLCSNARGTAEYCGGVNVALWEFTPQPQPLLPQCPVTSGTPSSFFLFFALFPTLFTSLPHLPLLVFGRAAASSSTLNISTVRLPATTAAAAQPTRSPLGLTHALTNRH